MKILESVEQFKNKIIVQGGDYKTAKSYGSSISKFLEFAGNMRSSPNHITTSDIEAYILHLVQSGKSVSYINQFIAAAKRFFNILGQPGKCAKIKYHDKPDTTPNVLSIEECLAMCNSNIYIKQKAIINLLYWGALRRSEVLNLKITDVSKDRRIFIRQSKFGKSRTITIPQHVLDLLREYYKECKPVDYLFNGDCNNMRYSEGSIEAVVKDTARKCRIFKRVYPHILRASRCTHLLDNGAQMSYVSGFLGHSDVRTTQKFYHKLTIGGMKKCLDDVDKKIMTEYGE